MVCEKILIGVISDTHIPERAQEIPKKVFEIFKGADLIIHAGDLSSLSVVEALNKIAQVKGVYGNMDAPEVCQKFPEKQIIKVGDIINIGIVHGRGHPKYLLDFVRKQFDQPLDVIIFGHSHRPFNEKMGGTLFFNPGSPTDTIFAPYNSCGILELKDKKIEGKIIKLDNNSTPR